MASSQRDLEAAIAATRFGLGARPGEIAAAAKDPKGYLKAQIRREGADTFPTGGDTSTQRLAAIVKDAPQPKYVQLDDGYQPAMGDWLETGKAFGGDVQGVLQAIRKQGFEPAIWVGPFIAEALNSAPDFVSWESVRVDLAEGSDARGLLKFSATGVFYVAAR